MNAPYTLQVETIDRNGFSMFHQHPYTLGTDRRIAIATAEDILGGMIAYRNFRAAELFGADRDNPEVIFTRRPGGAVVASLPAID